MPLLSIGDLAVVFGSETLFTNVTFQVERGERWGVIGRNGSGKSTLMQVLTGARAPDTGSVARVTGLRIAVMDQYRDFGSALTVWDAAARGFAELLDLEHDLMRQADAIGVLGDAATPEMLSRYSHDLERFEHGGGYAASARVDAVLAGMGFDPVVSRTRDLATLSGGERGRLALAGQLAAPADLLILDEPSNHLDIATTQWLERYLLDLDEAVLLISHDRALLSTVVDHVLHFEGNTATAYRGGYSEFIAQHAERAMAAARAVKQQRARIAVEEDYIRRNIAGQKSAQARGRRRRLERLPRLSPPPDAERAMAVAFNAGERGGDQVLVLDQLAIGVAGRQLLKPWSAVLRRGDVVGLIGHNGAGKSTLLRTILGERAPDAGSVRLMPSVIPAYYRQDLGDVDPDATIRDLIARARPMWNRGQIQGHLGRFGFSGDSILRRAGSLSGGERARVALALMMLREANLLIFDEPTNHLDVESIEALEDALDDYDGTVLMVTHDRALLAALADRIWSLDGATMSDFPGTFAEWQATLAARGRAAVPERSTAGRGAKASPTPPPPSPRKNISKTRRSPPPGSGRTTNATTLVDAEALVTKYEEALAACESRLADVDAYQQPDAGAVIRRLVEERDGAQASLDQALAAWEIAANGR